MLHQDKNFWLPRHQNTRQRIFWTRLTKDIGVLKNSNPQIFKIFAFLVTAAGKCLALHHLFCWLCFPKTSVLGIPDDRSDNKCFQQVYCKLALKPISRIEKIEKRSFLPSCFLCWSLKGNGFLTILYRYVACLNENVRRYTVESKNCEKNGEKW